jgi:hypothetical protein
MATEAQIIANRRNSQKSTGPRNPHGKAAVAQNAVKHGFSARQTVIKSENQADFDLFRDQILAELVPESPMESILAERIVCLSWRLERATRIQNQTVDTLDADISSNPLSKLIHSMNNTSDPDPNLALGRLAVKDFTNARVLDRLLMYERRIENSLYRTLLELQRLNLVKKMNTAQEMSIDQ